MGLTALATLVALAASGQLSANTLEAYSQHQYVVRESEDETTIPYRLLAPLDVEPGKRYPLVVFLHGAGERGTENKLQLLYFPEQMARPEYRAAYPCFLVAPQCRPNHKWVEVDWGAFTPSPMEEPTAEMLAVVGMVDELERKLPIDRRRIYLTGLSMGAYAAWDLAIRQPDRFARLAPICGGGDQRLAPRLANVPIWAWHGTADEAVPVVRSQRMIAAVRRAGGRPLYTELPGAGHNIWTPAYRDPELLDWMFEQPDYYLRRMPLPLGAFAVVVALVWILRQSRARRPYRPAAVASSRAPS